MKILGISAYYHDSAAAIVVDGEIVAAAQEERFTRRKHDARFPHYAVQFCLDKAKCTMKEINYVAFYDKPFIKFERLLETYLAFAPKGYKSFSTALPVWIKEKLFQKSLLQKQLKRSLLEIDLEEKLLFAEHHQSHAASAFYPSPFEKAAVLTMDGVGEWATTSLSIGDGHKLKMTKEIHFPHSLGLLYSAFTYYIGFKVNSGEYKVMGLAPYGEPKYVDKIYEHILDIKEDGSFRLNMDYFDYCTGLRMTNDKFAEVFGGPARKLDSGDLTQRHMDLAASVQKVTEDVVLKLANGVRKLTGLNNLCLAGGVALNCVANGKLLRENIFDRIWVQPAAGDAGGALGAALTAYHHHKERPRTVVASDAMKGSYLGPEFQQNEIESELTTAGAKFKTLSDDKFMDKVSSALVNGKAIGWFQGRMEYGPRALGARSIIADARSTSMQKNLNLKVKFRESFRPFAPSVLHSEVGKWFQLKKESPYMLLVADVAKDRQKEVSESEKALFGIEKLNVPRSDIPAVTHVDYSARIQTVRKQTNPRYYKLISEFNKKSSCPVIVNTSFNVRGEPIVCTPRDAFRCFMATDLDILAIGNCVLEKKEQDESLKEDYAGKYELD